MGVELEVGEVVVVVVVVVLLMLQSLTVVASVRMLTMEQARMLRRIGSGQTVQPFVSGSESVGVFQGAATLAVGGSVYSGMASSECGCLVVLGER